MSKKEEFLYRLLNIVLFFIPYQLKMMKYRYIHFKGSTSFEHYKTTFGKHKKKIYNEYFRK